MASRRARCREDDRIRLELRERLARLRGEFVLEEIRSLGLLFDVVERESIRPPHGPSAANRLVQDLGEFLALDIKKPNLAGASLDTPSATRDRLHA